MLRENEIWCGRSRRSAEGSAADARPAKKCGGPRKMRCQSERSGPWRSDLRECRLAEIVNRAVLRASPRHLSFAACRSSSAASTTNDSRGERGGRGDGAPEIPALGRTKRSAETPPPALSLFAVLRAPPRSPRDPSFAACRSSNAAPTTIDSTRRRGECTPEKSYARANNRSLETPTPAKRSLQFPAPLRVTPPGGGVSLDSMTRGAGRGQPRAIPGGQSPQQLLMTDG